MVLGIISLLYTEGGEAMSLTTLKKDIEDCRSLMIHLAMNSSLSDQKVIQTSTKLDRLLNDYHQLAIKKIYS